MRTPMRSSVWQGIDCTVLFGALLALCSDWALCRWLAHEAKVVAIPPSAFYCDDHKSLAAGYARFAFCKEDDSLVVAKQQLTSFFSRV